jgi:hypothetical protein
MFEYNLGILSIGTTMSVEFASNDAFLSFERRLGGSLLPI